MGQRAYIGKVCMDRNSPPDYVEASTLDSLQDTKRFMHQLYTMQQQHSHTQEHSSKPHAHHVQCGCHRQASTSLLASKDNTGKATPNSALSLNAAELEAALYPNRVNHLIQPILTPRFAPSCTSELMLSLGKLAEKHDLPIQTHVSENLVSWI